MSPSQFTLDVLSRFIGYNGYNSFLDGEALCEVQSLVVVSDKLTDKDLERGDCVRLSWPPDRSCVVMCLGEGHFVVSMAENTKLKVGDTFDCHLFIMNEPLFIDNLVHDGGKPVCYVAGKKDGITFEIEKGEFAIIVGPSGAGKTTVLNMLGGMDACSGGTITVDGAVISGYNARQLTGYRRHDIGFVFQFYNLVQNLTAKDNFPAQLSGGEQQRVAIARALAKNPKLLLCDEPTGALDYQTGKAILKLLQDTCREKGVTVIVITHNSALTPMADRVIRIRNGTVAEEILQDHPTPVEQIEW